MNKINKKENDENIEIVTTEKYWDCECENGYIHPKSENSCNICCSIAEEQPDSRVNEVLDQGFPL